MKFNKNYSIIFLFVLVTTRIGAQDTLNSATVEQKSYQLYLDKNWPELIKFGNAAVHKGYDYFYLQLRIGIAYYEKKNYCLAEGHFRSALKFNEDDELAQEYLYYCYVFTGKAEAARLFSKKFGNALAEKIGTNKQSSLGFIMLEGGTKKSDSASYYNAYRKADPVYFNPAVYFQLGLSHYIKNRVSLFYAGTSFKQKTFLNEVSQSQFYLKVGVPTKNNWLISPSLHWVNSKVVTEMLPPPPPPMSPPPRKIKVTTVSNYFVGSIAVQKSINKFVFSLGTTVSNISDKTQYINSGFVSCSVFGNSKLVIGCTGYAHTNDNYTTTYISSSPFIYVQPINRLSFKASYLLNTGNNIIEDNGYLVNNSSDFTTSRWAVLANLKINKHIALYGLYQLENKKEVVQLFKYKYNVIVAGLKITP